MIQTVHDFIEELQKYDGSLQIAIFNEETQRHEIGAMVEIAKKDKEIPSAHFADKLLKEIFLSIK